MTHWRVSIITASQLRAARALLEIDQRRLAEITVLSLPTIQRMEANEAIRPRQRRFLGEVAGGVRRGIEMIDEGFARRSHGRGVRLKNRAGFATARLNDLSEDDRFNQRRSDA